MNSRVFARLGLPAFSRHLMLAGTALCLVTAGPALGQTHVPAPGGMTRNISIPPQPLRSALHQLMQQGNLQIGFEAADVDGRTSSAVSGSMSVGEALSRLLAGTGLTFRYLTPGSVVLEPAPQSAGGAVQLGPVRVEGTNQSAGNGLAGDIATTEGTHSYAARAATIFKNAQSLKDIPQSVTVVTRQRLDDQNLVSIDDVMLNSPGITLRKRPGGGSDYSSRGFSMTNRQYDGVPLIRGSYTLGNGYYGATAYLDRVEIFRGAQGLLEGAGDPGGSVNLVRKRGLAQQTIALVARAGSWDHFGGQVDAGAPLTTDGSLRGRVVVDYDRSASFIDLVKDRTFIAYGALDYDIGLNTTIGVGIEYSRSHGTLMNYGLPRYLDGRPLDVPRSIYLGADWDRFRREETQVFADFEHRFSADWRFKAAGIYIRESGDNRYMIPSGTVDPVTLDGSSGIATDSRYRPRHFGVDVNINGQFPILGMPTELTLGATLSRMTSHDSLRLIPDYLSRVDVLNPQHNLPEPADSAYQPPNSYQWAPQSQKGIYGIVRNHLTDSLTFIIGGRLSWYDYVYKYSAWGGGKDTIRAKGKLTPYGGLVYAVSPQWSLYASYSDIFSPQTAIDAAGKVLKPIIGANYETGIKGELLDGRLTTSLALFRIAQTNRAITDFASGLVCQGGYCSIASGKVRSQGLEIEANGEVASGLSVSFGYTYNTSKFVKDPDNQGQVFSPLTPKHILRVWADYTLPNASRVSVGGGVNYQSKAFAGENTQPGYDVWNARIAYRLKDGWSVALNANNIFDKKYYSSISEFTTASDFFGDPRNVQIVLRGSFR